MLGIRPPCMAIQASERTRVTARKRSRSQVLILKGHPYRLFGPPQKHRSTLGLPTLLLLALLRVYVFKLPV